MLSLLELIAHLHMPLFYPRMSMMYQFITLNIYFILFHSFYYKLLFVLIYYYFLELVYIFSTIEDIRQASAMMLMDLDSLMKSWNYFSCVGSVMLSHVLIFKIIFLTRLLIYNRLNSCSLICPLL